MTAASVKPDTAGVAPAFAVAERRAEATLAMLRLVALLVLSLTTRVIGAEVDAHLMLLSLGAYGALAVTGIAAALAGFYRPWLPWLMATAEIVLLLHCLTMYGWMLDLPIVNALAAPGSALVYLYLAQAAVRRQPALVAYIGGLFIIGWAILYILWQNGLATRAPVATESQTDVAVRLALVALAASTLTVAVARGRRELVSSIVHGRVREILGRFVPETLVSSLEQDFSAQSGLRKAEAAVLFVDLRHFTAYAEQAALDQVVALLAEFRRRVTIQVQAHGGFVDKFVGDAVMAVFGGSTPRPDDGRRALACTEALTRDLADWLAERSKGGGDRIDYGITLHHGMVACGVVSGGGREEYTVLGDTVNVAARMQEVASQLSQRLLVSAPALDAAGVGNGRRASWLAVPLQAMRGRAGTIELFHPRPAQTTRLEH